MSSSGDRSVRFQIADVSIRDRAISSLRWATASQALAKLATWVITIYVIRLLEPADYGLMALAMAAIEIASMLGGLGLNAAVVQRHRHDEAVTSKLFGLVILSNLSMFALIQVGAGVYAMLYDEPAIADILRVVAFGLLLRAAGSMPQALLMRRVEFKALALVNLGGRILAALTVLTMAMNGHGVWSLVAGYLAGSLVSAAAIIVLTRFRLRPSFNVTGIATELRFGFNMVGKSLVSFLNRRIDVLLIGRLAGAEALGSYAVAADVARMPVRLLMPPVVSVTFPTMARLQDDVARVSKLFVRMIAAVTFLLLPLLLGAALVAEPLIELVLGAKWLTAAPILTILALVMPIRAPFRLLQSTLDGLGRADVGLRNLLTVLVCLPVGLGLGSSGGLTGIATGWALAHVVALVVNLRRSLPVIAVEPIALARALLPTAAACAAMACGVLVLDGVLPLEILGWQRLLALVGTGAAIYMLVSLAINRAVMAELIRLLRPSIA